MNQQPNIPGIVTADNTIECVGAQLHEVIATVEAQGFFVAGMVANGARYTLRLARATPAIPAAINHTAQLDAATGTQDAPEGGRKSPFDVSKTVAGAPLDPRVSADVLSSDSH